MPAKCYCGTVARSCAEALPAVLRPISTSSRKHALPNATLLDRTLASRLHDGEPPHRRGFMEIRERDGPRSKPRDARNRLGRPRRATAP